MRVTLLGHSCFLVETGGARLVIDPYLASDPQSKIAPADLPCDAVLISHAHEDHSCDAAELARLHGAMIVANYEICEYFTAKGLKCHGLNPGGGFNFPFGRITLTTARHSSSFGENPLAPVYMGEACGLLVSAEGKTLYHAGDTALFLDMQLIGRAGLDLALLPIGDNFTMGPADAIDALDFLRPKLCVPMHYNTWPVIRQDAGAFAEKAAQRGHTVRVLRHGEALTL